MIPPDGSFHLANLPSCIISLGAQPLNLVGGVVDDRANTSHTAMAA